MAFFRRVMDHLLNQVLVESLANSRWFQKFAVWSNNAYKEMAAKTKDPSAITDHATKAAETGKQTWQKWRQDFSEELRKIQEEVQKQSAAKKR